MVASCGEMKRHLFIGLCFLLIGITSSATQAQENASQSGWVNISDSVTSALAKEGVKIPWPGGTAGMACDRTTGQVYMEVAGVGLWTSDDHGQSFKRIAQGEIGGRCEFGYAMNMDPAGRRLACFMLDGRAGMTLDGGKSWQDFADVGRNWDFGAVDWSQSKPRGIFACHHESGGEVYLSDNAGESWRFLGKRPGIKSVGIFGTHILVAGENGNLVRSTDDGKTWQTISPYHPVGRVAVAFKGKVYWLAREGLIVSTDRGASWHLLGSPVNAGWGPLFGEDQNHIVVANFHGFLKTDDAGKTWTPLASLPPIHDFAPKQPGQFLSIGWDPRANILYASCMSNPAYKLQLQP